jgi:hypothetical protein
MHKLSAMLFAAAVVAACETHEEVLAVPTTGVDIMPNETAIRVLTGERCRREAACGRVGPGRQLDTESTCEAAAELDERSSIGLDACPFGVGADQLRQCLAAVRAQPCDHPMRSLSDIFPCRRMEMCR